MLGASSLRTPLWCCAGDVRSLHFEGDSRALQQRVLAIFSKYMKSNVSTAISCVSSKAKKEYDKNLHNIGRLENDELRKFYDVAEKTCFKYIETTCFNDFLKSPQYSYVLALKLKERAVPEMEQFMAKRVLGDGHFGQVRNRICNGM